MENMFVVPAYVVEKYVTDDHVLQYCHDHKLHPLDLAQYTLTNVSTVAKLMEYKVYDVALPIYWVREVQERFGINPVGNVVWCYDKARTYGGPAPVTREGEVLCKILEHIHSR